MEPASAVAFAGLIKMVRSGKIKPSDVVVINLTGHTLPVEKMILGEGWARNLVLPSKALDEKPEEGSAISSQPCDTRTVPTHRDRGRSS